MRRRDFLAAGPGAVLGVALTSARSWASGYPVGVGRGADPYVATERAIEASGEWPRAAVAGRTVVIKPNLLGPVSAETGMVTDPRVVQAVVDRSLADGARAVTVVETSRYGAFFEQTGYGLFNGYDERVTLLDLRDVSPVLAPVAGGGLAYSAVWVPSVLLGSDVVFVSAAKMKTHLEAMATLATKNLFGLPVLERYVPNEDKGGRFTMHERGLHLTIGDLLRIRPVHFCVIDGVFAMEGRGPISGQPVAMNTVLAGANPIAVDRVGLYTMGIAQPLVPHLTYCARLGLGPSDLSSVTVHGDTLSPRAFMLPSPPPLLGYPRINPTVFAPRLGQSTTLQFAYGEPTFRMLRIVRHDDETPATEVIRTLLPDSYRDTGMEVATWDGRDDDGQYVSTGLYAVQVTASSLRAVVRPAAATAWLRVV